MAAVAAEVQTSSRKPVITAAAETIMVAVEMTTTVAAATMAEALPGVPSLAAAVAVEAAMGTVAVPAQETTEVVPSGVIAGYGSKATENDGSFYCEFRSERKNLGDRPLESLCILCMPEYESFHVSRCLKFSPSWL